VSEEHERVPHALQQAHHSALGRLLPALVHRANNSLSVIHGTLEIATGLSSVHSELVEGETRTLSRILEQIAHHAHEHLGGRGCFDFAQVTSEVELLVGCAARFSRVPFEARLAPGAVIVEGCEARLKRFLISYASERLAALVASTSSMRALRLTSSRGEDHVHLRITDGGLASALVSPALEEEARWLCELGGLHIARRSRRGVHALQVSLVHVPSEAPLPRADSDGSTSILLVQPAGEEAELNATVLAENGYRVVHRATIGEPEFILTPPSGFDLVLMDAELLGSEPRMLAAWRDAPPRGVGLLGRPDGGMPTSLSALAKPIRPQALLELVSNLRAAQTL